MLEYYHNFKKSLWKLGMQSWKSNHTVFKISTDLFQVRHGSSLQEKYLIVPNNNSFKKIIQKIPGSSRKFQKLPEKSYLIRFPVRAFDALCSKFFWVFLFLSILKCHSVIPFEISLKKWQPSIFDFFKKQKPWQVSPATKKRNTISYNSYQV